MLNERQLKIVDLLEQQPRTPGELAQQTGVSGRTILRDPASGQGPDRTVPVHRLPA